MDRYINKKLKMERSGIKAVPDTGLSFLFAGRIFVLPGMQKIFL
jgi:hypothetical protein